MDESTVKEQLKRLKETALGFRQSALLLAAMKADLFDRIGVRHRSVDEFIRPEEDQQSLVRVCDALVSLDLLEKEEGRYRCSPAARECLTRQGGFDIGSLLKHFHEVYEIWGDLDRVLIEGQGIHAEQGDEEQFSPEFMEAMEVRAHFAKQEIAERLKDVLGSGRLLDLGGGTGVFARALLEAAPGASGVIADLPHVVEEARSYVERDGLEDRLETRSLDLLEDTSYGSDFDMVLISAIAHMFGPDDIRRILNRAAGALRAGGHLVLRDYLLEEDRTAPTDAALFDLHMLLVTEAGGNHSESKYRNWMGESGLESIRRMKLTQSTDDLLIGRKRSG